MKPRKYDAMILSLINQSHDHLIAEEIYLKLKQQEPKVVMASVYNNLKALYQENKIRKIVVEGQPDCYDRMVRHDHLICKECGSISDLVTQDLSDALQSQLGESYLGYELQIFYCCPTCQKKRLSAMDQTKEISL